MGEVAVGIWTTGPTPHSQPLVGLRGDRKAEKVVGAVPKARVGAGDMAGLPDQRQDGAGDDVPVVVDMDRDHRLDIQDFLRAVVRPDVEIGVALKGEAVEVADRVLQLLGEVGGALARRVVAGRRLLGLRRGEAGEGRGRSG